MHLPLQKMKGDFVQIWGKCQAAIIQLSCNVSDVKQLSVRCHVTRDVMTHDPKRWLTLTFLRLTMTRLHDSSLTPYQHDSLNMIHEHLTRYDSIWLTPLVYILERPKETALSSSSLWIQVDLKPPTQTEQCATKTLNETLGFIRKPLGLDPHSWLKYN